MEYTTKHRRRIEIAPNWQALFVQRFCKSVLDLQIGANFNSLLSVYVTIVVAAIIFFFKIDPDLLKRETESHKQSHEFWVNWCRLALRALPLIATVYLSLSFTEWSFVKVLWSPSKVEQITPIARQVEDVSTPAPPQHETILEQIKLLQQTDAVAKNSGCGTCAAELQFDSISIANKCNKDIWVAYHYDKSKRVDQWVTRGWLKISSGETIKPPIRSHGRLIYFYAKTSDGKIWDGSNDPEAKLLEVDLNNEFSSKVGGALQGNNVSQVSFFSVDAGDYYGEAHLDLSCD